MKPATLKSEPALLSSWFKLRRKGTPSPPLFTVKLWNSDEFGRNCLFLRLGIATTRRAFHSRLMSEAMQAAPKPLSMLTTEMLGEQVFSIPSSAAMPPNDAP
jgi:hypothetical protein